MFQQISNKTAINLIVGSLGAGKTTLIKNLLKKKPTTENWAILVNEFGAIGIDGAILEDSTDNQAKNSYKIKQIPGGCICCTALSGFQDAIKDVMQDYTPDRIFIEPTGIGEPESMVDLLNNDYFKQHFDIQTIFAVLDSKVSKVEHFKQMTIMQNLLDVADVIVFNKTDTADSHNLEKLNEYTNQLYPPKTAIVNTQNSLIEYSLISKVQSNKKPLRLSLNNTLPSNDEHHQIHSTNLTQQESGKDLFEKPANTDLKNLIERKSQQQLQTISIGWVFNNMTEFDWKKVLSLFKQLTESKFSQTPPLRSKGVFKVGEPCMLFQWVNGQDISREFIAYKRDSRIEILLAENNKLDINLFEKKLAKCIK